MRTTREWIYRSAGLALAWGIAASASGDIIVDNLTEPVRAVTILGVEDPDQIWASQSFSTPIRATLDQVTLLVGQLLGDPLVIAELRSGAGPDERTEAVLAIPAITGGDVENAVFIPDTPVTLVPGRTYWVVLGVQSGGSIGWAYADSNQWQGPGLIGGFAYSFDFGGTWTDYGSDFPHQLRIDATPIACPADLNGDGLVDFADYLDFLNYYDTSDLTVDYNGDGLVDFGDYLEFLNYFDAGC